MATPMITRANPPTHWRSIAVAGYALIILTFGIVGGWSAVTKIDRAIDAPGVVAVETNRKTIQHLEGGIINAILVKEGQHVEPGDVLFRMDDVQAKASFQAINGELTTALAQEARLVAERDQTAKIAWPSEIADRMKVPLVQQVVDDQEGEFRKRRQSLNAQVDVLNSRIQQLSIQNEGIEVQRKATVNQVEFIDKELVGLRDLNEKKLIPVTRLYAMERERERLQGIVGQAISDEARDQGQAGELKYQIEQVRQHFQEDVAANLVAVRQRIDELKQKKAVATDIFKRGNVVAPVSGTVQNIRVFTIGQVVRPGEPMAEVIPDDEPLIVEAMISPNDIDGISAGLSAEIRFPSFHSRLIPLMIGKLQSVSHDRLVDEANKQSYYRGIVALDKAKIPKELAARIRPGMPAEIVISTGERTVLSYFVSPLTSTLRHSFIN